MHTQLFHPQSPQSVVWKILPELCTMMVLLLPGIPDQESQIPHLVVTSPAYGLWNLGAFYACTFIDTLSHNLISIHILGYNLGVCMCSQGREADNLQSASSPGCPISQIPLLCGKQLI